VPTIVLGGGLDRCLNSIGRQQGIAPDVLLVQNGPGVADVCGRWEARGISVHRPARNLGVAASWNWACQWAWARGHDAIALLNDDLALTDQGTLFRFRDAVECEPRQLYFLVGRGFSAACLTRTVWDEVGEFDEGFWPAYMEDCDYHWRAKLRGIPAGDLDIPSEHVGSMAIRSDTELEAIVSRLFWPRHARYQAKWGGYPGREVYSVAWNGGQPWPSLQDSACPQ